VTGGKLGTSQEKGTGKRGQIYFEYNSGNSVILGTPYLIAWRQSNSGYLK
jgi:hypothetical protein